MRALRRFTVRASLPQPLEPLAPLVTNLRWSWHPETRDLFEALDPELWRTCGGDPVKVLGEVSAERLGTLPRTAGSSAGCRTWSTTCRST